MRGSATPTSATKPPSSPTATPNSPRRSAWSSTPPATASASAPSATRCWWMTAWSRCSISSRRLARRRLEIEQLEHAVIHQHRVALGADAEAVAGGVELHADRLGEFGVAVGEEGGFVALVGVALPRVHDEGVVDRDDGDGVDALVLDGVGVEENARQMHLVTGAGVGAGHREQRHLLALENIVGGLDLRTFRRHNAKFGLGQLVDDF